MAVMNTWPLKVQGRALEQKDVESIRAMLHEHPEWGRTRLSEELCRHWGWYRSDGQMKDMACRTLLRKLEQKSLITLPSRRRMAGAMHLPRIVEDVVIDQTPLSGRLYDHEPVRILDARQTKELEKTFNYLMMRFHYLGYQRPVGQNMKYIFMDNQDRILGCVLFGAAAWKIQCRDEWIGWNAGVREQRLQRICNNTRFLILPWVRVTHLASHVLGACAKRVASDWDRRYGLRVVLLETFVDTTRFHGTCYKAANWRLVGKTKGRGRQDRYSNTHVPVKDIWVYPLCKDFRKYLLS